MASQNTYTTAPDSSYPRRFPFTFPSLDSSEVYVSVAGTNKTVGASNDYTVGNYNKTSGGYIEFVSDTTRGTGTVRVYRLTDGSTLKRDFQAGSAIKADDLNTANKQAIYLAEEARQDFTNLATSGTTSGFAIDGSNIAPNSIDSGKIKDLEVKAADLSSSTSTDSDRAVTTNHIRDNAVTTDKLANDSVTADKLKDSASTDSDRAVTTNHIRDGAVTDAKVGSGISGTKVTPSFGSQNISTTGTLNAGSTTVGSLNSGTTTTGATTASSIAVTNNLTLSSGNATNKGLIFPTDIGGGSGDVAYIRYYVDGGGENTRLHIGNENDADDDIYLQTGLVHTNGNLSVNGTITGGSFSGNGSGLTGLGNVRSITESAVTGSATVSTSTYQDRVVITVNTISSSRVLVFYSFEHRHSSTDNRTVNTRVTSSTGFVGGNPTFTERGTAMVKENGNLFDISNHTGNRTYKIQWSRNSQGNGTIQNAYLVAIEFTV